MKRLIAMLFLPLLAGCPSNPPYLAGPELETQVRALPGADGRSDVFGNVSWHPFLREAGRHGDGWRGALVLSHDAMAFVIWDANLQRVDIAKRIAYADMKSVTMEGTGGSTLMVVRERDGAVHGFGFHGAVRVDADAAQRAVALANERMAAGRGGR